MTLGRIDRAWMGLVVATALVAGCGSDRGVSDTGQDPADGVWWKTEPQNDGTGNPPPGWVDPYTHGTMTLTGPDDARFDGPAGVVEFTRTDLVDHLYPCE